MINYFHQRKGALAHDAGKADWVKIISERKIKAIHCLATARMEIIQRNWDKNEEIACLNNPCSLIAAVNFACEERLKKGPDFETQKEIVFQLLQDSITQMSRGKYTDIIAWEQAQNTKKNIIKALEKASLTCVKAL